MTNDKQGDPSEPHLPGQASWDCALTDEEIGLLHEGVPPNLIRPDKLIEWWPLRRSETMKWTYEDDDGQLFCRVCDASIDHDGVCRCRLDRVGRLEARVEALEREQDDETS